MKARMMQFAKFAIGWPLSIVAIYFIYRTFSSQINGFALLENLNYPLLIIAILLYVAYYFLRSYFWLKLLHFLGHDIPFRDSSFMWLFAQLKRYIPGNIWSYLGLAVSYNERKVTKKEIASAILIESEIVIIVTFILSLLSLPFVLHSFISLPINAEVLTWGLAILFMLGAIVYLFIGRLIKKPKGKAFTVLRHLFPTYTPKQSGFLMVLMFLAYICYSLGYFFSISAVFPLDSQHLLTYIGIFMFSLVAGYLSFITPTGLGVREGFMTLGLAKFIPVGIAGFSALFSRLIIVVAELIALIISYIWYKSPKHFRVVEHAMSHRLHEVVLWFMIGLFSVYFSVVSVLRYTYYFTGRFDLGNMAQTVWNTSQGRIFQISDPNGTETISRLAFHADFILALLAPLYWIWADPRILLIFQAVVVGLGAYFVYKIGNLILKNQTLSLVLAFSYLMNPSIQRATVYDFHAVVLATTFLLGAVYFILQKRYGWFLTMAILAALTKEQLWFVIALFGPYLFFIQKQRLFGLSVFAIGVSLFYYVIWIAIPGAAGSAHFALSYFSEGGASPTDIIKNIVLSPVDSMQTAFSGPRLDYYLKLLFPVGFLAIAFPFWLLFASPDIVLNVFSDRVQLHQIYYQYTAVISAFIYVSAIYGLRMLLTYIPRVSASTWSGYLVICAILGSYLYGPLPGSIEANLAVFNQPLKEQRSIDLELAKIPATAQVSASNNIASHLSEREYIYVIPRGIGLAEYVIIFTPYSPTNAEDIRILSELRLDKRYEQYAENSQAVFFRKTLPKTPDTHVQ